MRISLDKKTLIYLLNLVVNDAARQTKNTTGTCGEYWTRVDRARQVMNRLQNSIDKSKQ